MRIQSRRRALAKVKSHASLPSKRDAATKLKNLLPSLWKHFKELRREGEAGEAESDAFSASFSELRHFLSESALRVCSELSSRSDALLLQALRAVGRKHCVLRQPLGHRYIDSSKSWSVDNVVGHAARTVGKAQPWRAQEVAWRSYQRHFKLTLKKSSRQDASGREFQIKRVMRPELVRTRVEKRRRRDRGGPLAQELVHVTAHSRRELAQEGKKRIKLVRRVADLLPAVIFRPLKTARLPRWTLIYLHGMGSSALECYADRPHFFLDGTAAVKVVIPTAPLREVSCFDAWWIKDRAEKWTLQKFWSWYDYTSNHNGRKEDNLDIESLHSVQRALHHIIRQEAKELNGRTDRIILGGKSQGCATGLDAALTFPKRLGGFVGLVGHVLGCTPVEANGPQKQTPLHFFHEAEDDVIRWDWVKPCEQRLRDAGYRVYSRRMKDPEGNGHFIEGSEGVWIRQALRSITSSVQRTSNQKLKTS